MAVVVLAVTALVLRSAGLSLSIKQSSARTPRFWWMLTAFLAPLGITSRLVFCDGLMLQFAVITAIAGVGIWIGDRAIERLKPRD